MADAPETASTLDGLFKRRYVDSTEYAIPKWAVFQNTFAFDSANKIGEDYRQAVLLRNPNGHTWNGGGTYGTAFTLNDALAGAVKQANLKGSEYLLREIIAYGLVSRTADGGAAIDPAVDTIIRAMIESSAAQIEMNALYGGGSIGTVSSISRATAVGTIVLTTASFAPGLWQSLEGGYVDVYDTTGVTKRTANGPATVTAIDLANLTLTITFANGTDCSNTVATDIIVPYGASGNWANGIDYAITQSAAGGTVFGLSAGTYGNWKASTYAVSGPLTFSKLASASARSVVRGGLSAMTCYVSPYTWIDMMTNEASLRRYQESSRSEFENGADRISFYSANGKLSVVPHAMIKAGEAFLLGDDDWRFIGSTMPTFEQPGRGPTANPYYLREAASSAGYEVRRYSDCAVFTPRIARQVKLTSITNSTTVG